MVRKITVKPALIVVVEIAEIAQLAVTITASKIMGKTVSIAKVAVALVLVAIAAVARTRCARGGRDGPLWVIAAPTAAPAINVGAI
jgi:hypothetical protein